MVFPFLKKKVNTPKVVVTEHPASHKIMQNFAMGINEKKFYSVKDFDLELGSFASYGYLRGVGELYKKANDFWYLDHGYFKQVTRDFKNNDVFIRNFEGYFRIVHNNFWHNGSIDFPEDRFEKLELEVKSQKKTGDFIIVSEPTFEAMKYYSLEDWTMKTIHEIKKFSDRKIIIHNRNSDIPLNSLLEDAWAFVSDHSGAGFMSMLRGVPAIFTNKTLKSIGEITNIENIKINEKVLMNLAYCQWTLEEIKSGEAWEFISKRLL